MKKYPVLILSLLFLSIVFSSQTYSQVYDSVSTKEIAPGIIHKRFVCLKDTIITNILKIDLKKGKYYIKSAKAKNNRFGRTKTTEITSLQMASGDNVIAAINADFFNVKNGEMENNMITEGEILKAITVSGSPREKAKSIYPQFAFTYDDQPVIDRFLFKGELILNQKEIYKINGINTAADSNSIVLFNHFQGNTSPQVSESWANNEYEIIPLKTGADTMLFVTGKTFEQKGNNAFGENTWVLSANNSLCKQLKDRIHEKDTLRIIMKFLPDRYKIRTLAGGRGAIVKNGRNVGSDIQWTEGIAKSFSLTKHPRTGIGFNEDGSIVFFITVDGRQSTSRGISLESFADLMIKEGIYQGLNLDGGGSTTMVVNGSIVNSPSDKEGERAVGNCLLLIGDNTTLSKGGK